MGRQAGAWRAAGRAARPAAMLAGPLGLLMALYFATLWAGGRRVGEPNPSDAVQAARAAAGVAAGVGYAAAVFGVWVGCAAAVGWARGGRPGGS